MKKSLLAVAAMTAFAGAAQAQSSVTVYGLLDLGYINTNYNGTSITANAANVNNAAVVGSATQKQTTSGFGQSAESTSRIGFKGNEDLGGGLSAVFTLELGLSPDSNGAAASGTTTSTTAVSTPAAWGQINRQAFVGLKKSGVGTTTIGTQYTPLFDVQSITDAAGNNNLIGNAVYSGSAQSSTGSFNQGVGPYAGGVSSQSLNAVTGAYTTRVSNALKFQSDRFAGLAGQLFYAQANQNTTQTASGYSASAGGANNNTAWGVNGDYVWNKLQVVAAYQGISSINYSPATVQTTASSTYAAGTADSFGNNMRDTQTYAAATYDFGILKAYYQYVNRKAVSTIDSSFFTKRSANQVGVKSSLTPTITAYATFGLGNSSYYGNGVTGSTQGANFRTFQIGTDYFLSKRTNLYLAAGAANQSSNGNTTQSTVATQAQYGGVGTSGSNVAAGIRHTF